MEVHPSAVVHKAWATNSEVHFSRGPWQRFQGQLMKISQANTKFLLLQNLVCLTHKLYEKSEVL